MSILGNIARALIGKEPYNPRLEPEALKARKNAKKAGGSDYGFPRWKTMKSSELSTNQRLRAFLNAEKLKTEAQQQQDTVTLSQQATKQTTQEPPKSVWSWGSVIAFLFHRKALPEIPGGRKEEDRRTDSLGNTEEGLRV